MRDPMALPPSPAQTIGPFFHFALEWKPRLAPGGERLTVRVLDGAGAPVPDALLELAQPAGGFGRLPTDSDGAAAFEGVAAADYANVVVFARGLLDRLLTRIYFDAGAEALLRARRSGTGWEFEIRLQGERETPFFDV